MHFDKQLSNWILNYLQGCKQQVRINSTISAAAVTNIGAPQGCVLSPVLFTIYTNNHRSAEPHTVAVKYADDTAAAGLISNNDEEHYRNIVACLVSEFDSDDLELNVKKKQKNSS